jgi:hypothetical protein
MSVRSKRIDLSDRLMRKQHGMALQELKGPYRALTYRKTIKLMKLSPSRVLVEIATI